MSNTKIVNAPSVGKKYAIWNNKGGVGKTFLTFVLASEYAKKYPERKVCVIDVCPQANVSEILLGGNGKGETALAGLLAKRNNRKTIGGYFDQRLSSNPSNVNYADYALPVNGYAPKLPKNLFLVCGDPSLELQVPSINQTAAIQLPPSRWRDTHSWIIDLQRSISGRFENVVDYFIDCNPSFATYTAQALVASDDLIVPCTADGSSARAIDNLGRLIYGIGLPSSYSTIAFCTRAVKEKLKLPKIHTVLFNRSTTYSKGKPATAFKAMYQEIKSRVDGLRVSTPTAFVANPQFENMPDAHTVSIVASELARCISELKVGPYRLRQGDTQVNGEPLGKYQIAVKKIVGTL